MSDANSKPVVVNYGSNSHKSKQAPDAGGETKPEVVRVVSEGGLIEKKPSLRKKFLAAFAGDDAQSVGDYLLFQVITPSIKNLLSDLVIQTVERSLFGTSRPRSSQTYVGGGGRSGVVNYSSYSRPGTPQQPSQPILSERDRSSHDWSQFVIERRPDAEAVVDTLQALIDAYNVATVSDFFRAIGVTPQHTDMKFGWNNIGGSRIIPVRDGFILDLPRPIVLQ